MQKRHTIAEGECLASIAAHHGMSLERIWEHPANAELKRLRQNPHVLRAGDVVHIPEAQQRHEQRGTGRTHTFRVRGRREQLRVRLVDDGVPRAGLSYVLDVEGVLTEGVTDADGWVEQWVSASAVRARLELSPQEAYELRLGELDPITTDEGVFARLRNLGFVPSGNEEESAYFTALVSFQKTHDLPLTGEADDATRDALLRAHGS